MNIFEYIVSSEGITLSAFCLDFVIYGMFLVALGYVKMPLKPSKYFVYASLKQIYFSLLLDTLTLVIIRGM